MFIEPETFAPENGSIARRVLGRSGHPVSILGMGGGELFYDQKNRDEVHLILQEALRLGVNYFDTSPDYGDSEILYGEFLKTRSEEIFVATKVNPRTRDEAWRSIENSLKRLQTDFIHLIQVHQVDYREEIDLIVGPDGALKALVEAEDQGLCRWIGITGHRDPDVLLYGLDRYDFDTILMPVNVADRHYLSFLDICLPKARERFMGIIGMKAYCAGGVFETLKVTPKEALGYTLSQKIDTAIVGVDNIDQLRENVRIAREWEQMGEDEMNAGSF